jgi:hypothetical protein
MVADGPMHVIVRLAARTWALETGERPFSEDSAHQLTSQHTGLAAVAPVLLQSITLLELGQPALEWQLWGADPGGTVRKPFTSLPLAWRPGSSEAAPVLRWRIAPTSAIGSGYFP